MRHKLPNDIRALGETQLFRDLSPRELDDIQRLGTVIDRDAGQVLCRADQYAGQIGVVVRGEIAAVTAGGRRRELRKGDWFGSPGALRHETEPEEIVTVSRATLFVMSPRELASVRFACPRLAARLANLCSDTPSSARPGTLVTVS